jgi:hypothetical protein
MLVLIPAVAWRRSWWSVLALEVAAVGFLALWGLVVPAPAVIRDIWSGGPTLRVLTCNVQLGDLKVAALADLIRQARPDLVLLQECRLDDPGAVLGREGWYVRSEGEFCVASRLPIVRFSALRRPDRSFRIVAVRADLSWEGRTIPVVSAHLMTPRDGLEAIMHSPLRGPRPSAWSRASSGPSRPSCAAGSPTHPARSCWRAILTSRPSIRSIVAIGRNTRTLSRGRAWGSAGRCSPTGSG